MRTLIAWFADNHVAANLLMIFLLLAGVLTGMSMKLEVFPEFSMDSITISTVYVGASPAEVEEAIVCRIEESVSGLAGIKRIDSTAREGHGVVTIEVMKDWDLQNLLDEVKAEVDRITTFPKEAEKPLVQEMTGRAKVISLAIYGDASEATIKALAEKLKDDITNLPGITFALLTGVREAEIHIEIPEKTLRRYALTLGEVADLVRKSSLDLPAGDVKTKAGEILIRTKGRRYYAADYHDVAVITNPDGSEVTLGQIATLKDGFQDMDLRTRFQGKPAAVIEVFRVADQNALDVADTVKRYVNDIRQNLPEGLDIGLFEDMSRVLRSRINLLLINMAMGLVLVTILLGLFLDLRLAFWVTLGIPISFMTGLWVLPSFDVSINMVSLFAFIMVLGIVVDDAIIIGENIFRKQEEGLKNHNASVEGAVEMGKPVIFAVLTTVVAFWPLLLGTGVMGKIIQNIPIVVMLVLLGSIVEALFILPAHLNRSGRGRAYANTGTNKKEKPLGRWLKQIISGPYAGLLDFCLRWRYATVAFGMAILMLTLGIWQGGWLNFIFFTRVDGDSLFCTLTMPTGTPMERTVEVVRHLEQSAKKAILEMDKQRPEGAPSLLENSLSRIGFHIGVHGTGSSEPQYGSHLAQVFIQLLDGEKRDISAMRLANLWREKAGPIPESDAVTFQSELFSMGNPVEVHLSLDDHERLLAAAEELKLELESYPGVFDVNDSYLPGKKEMQLKLKPSGLCLGISLNELARQVRHAFYGAEALRLQRDQDEVKVLVRYPESGRRSLSNMENMRIRMPGSKEVPFKEIAEVKMEQGYVAIQRAQRRRIIKVSANIDWGIANATEVNMALITRILPQLKNQYPQLRYSMGGEGKELIGSMNDVMMGFGMALLGIYALLAIPFRSFFQPFIVLAAVPFGIAGAFMGHLIMGIDLSILSLFGIVGTTGVVVNDSLVLIHATNKLRRQGMTAYDAVARAGGLRFRAIILTSLTTFAGLTPMLLERSLQAQVLVPMAVSLAFGVLFATWITLLLIPCGYVIMDDLYNLLNRLKSKVVTLAAS